MVRMPREDDLKYIPQVYHPLDESNAGKGNDMNEDVITTIAQELELATYRVRATIALLEQGATIPFIARYRKEATDSLDEVTVALIRDRPDGRPEHIPVPRLLRLRCCFLH